MRPGAALAVASGTPPEPHGFTLSMLGGAGLVLAAVIVVLLIFVRRVRRD